MNVTTEAIINAPQQKIAELLANPANNPKWMVNLESFAPLSGKPGDIGATYELRFKSGNMTFKTTTTKRDLPNELQISMDSQMVHILTVARLKAISPTSTQYIFEQDFQFKGFFNKLMGKMVGGTLRKQQEKDVAGLKAYLEGK